MSIIYSTSQYLLEDLFFAMTTTSTISTLASDDNHNKSHRGFSIKHSICFTLTFITLLIFLQAQAFNYPFLLPHSTTSLSLLFRPSADTASPNSTRYRSMLRKAVLFLPLKDVRFSDHDWFMSSLKDEGDPGEAVHLSFPSEASARRLLCLAGRDTSDGARNSYALAWAEALPENATLLPGLTFVSDTQYDYSNLWHGLSAVVPFVSWHERNGCPTPARWVLYHWGELRTGMGSWVQTLSEAAIGNKVRIEKFDSGGGPACFTKAVVFRHNEGGMVRGRKQEVYDMMRCRARAYCNVTAEATGDVRSSAVRMTMLFRSGSRSFKDEATVIRIFEAECRKVAGCRSKLVRTDKLTFCDQVKLMGETDVLISQHGAQMTNMIFMDKGSSVMEFFPKGWLELAGPGQYVFRWLADWSGMRHEGQWKDPNGEECPHKSKEDCFTFYKDGQIGHNETFFANWTARVLNEVRASKLAEPAPNQQQYRSAACPCQ